MWNVRSYQPHWIVRCRSVNDWKNSVFGCFVIFVRGSSEHGCTVTTVEARIFVNNQRLKEEKSVTTKEQETG